MLLLVFIIFSLLFLTLFYIQTSNLFYNVINNEIDDRKYTTLLDPLDKRDFIFNIPFPSNFTQISQDWSTFVSNVLDQGNIGACASNASSQAINIYENVYKWKNNINTTSTPLRSRLYTYYKAREIYPGYLPVIDDGTSLRAIMKVVVKNLPYENEWPYDTLNVNTKPPDNIIMQNNIGNLVFSYYRIPIDLSLIKSALLKNVIICRINCPAKLPNKKGVINPMDKSIVKGGHTILIVGFNDETRQLKILNSWGEKWGLDGYGYIPYDYINDYITDMWILYMNDMSITSWGVKYGLCETVDDKRSWIEYSDILKPNSTECWFRYCVNPDKTTCGLAKDSTPKYTGCYVNDTLGTPKTLNQNNCL